MYFLVWGLDMTRNQIIILISNNIFFNLASDFPCMYYNLNRDKFHVYKQKTFFCSAIPVIHLTPILCLLPVLIDGFNNSSGKTSLISPVIKDNKTNKNVIFIGWVYKVCSVYSWSKDKGNVIPCFIWSEMIAMMNCCPEAIATDTESVATVTKYLISVSNGSCSFILISWIRREQTNRTLPLKRIYSYI